MISPQRRGDRRGRFPLLQSGDGDWSRNSVSSRIRLNPSIAMALVVSLLIVEQKPFCLSAFPDKQKILSLRPRWLCGETIISDKSDYGY